MNALVDHSLVTCRLFAKFLSGLVTLHQPVSATRPLPLALTGSKASSGKFVYRYRKLAPPKSSTMLSAKSTARNGLESEKMALNCTSALIDRIASLMIQPSPSSNWASAPIDRMVGCMPSFRFSERISSSGVGIFTLAASRLVIVP